MVSKDAIVGAVGAVVLLAVMVGVFAYEYNNPVEPGPGNGDGGDDWSMRYAALDRAEDLDGDGLPNGEDGDLDGDGVDNAADNETAVVVDLSGTLASGLPGTATRSADIGSFFVGAGAEHAMGWVNYTLPAPAPVGAGMALVVEVLRNGTVIATAERGDVAAGQSQAGHRFELGADELAQAGNLTVRVTSTSPDLGREFVVTGAVHVHYRMGGGDHSGHTGFEKRA